LGSTKSPEDLARTVIDRPATREVIPHFDGESFRWVEHDYPSPMARWNYHPEVEIHLIRRSIGSYIIGDQVGAFGPGHVAIVGPGLAHDWMSDRVPGEVVPKRDAVIQFTVEWLDRTIAASPEMSGARRVVDDSARGIVYTGPTAREAAEEIEAIGATQGLRRMSHLCALFGVLQDAPREDRQYISHKLYSSDMGRQGKAAVEAGLAYVLENLSGEIRMSEAARLAHMSEPSFSKYFKKASGMTFTDLVKRLRIASACRLLEQTDSTVAAISVAVGYGNLANFNRQFRAATGITPRVYRALDPAERPTVGTSGSEDSAR
jgi:AraC-like DNA-binding protein